MDPVEVWLHDKTGEFFLVGNDGATVYGPVRPDEVLRQYRRAIEPHEWVLRIPCFYEVFRTFPNPHPYSEYSKYEISWLPPSVTRELLPEDHHACIDWQPRLEKDRIDEAVAIAQQGIASTFPERPAIGKLTTPFRGHPEGSVVICHDVSPGQSMRVIEWP